jgi:hypothetical protein
MGLPLDDLVRGGLECVGRACAPAADERLAAAAVVVAEWDASQLEVLLDGRQHVLVLDPPYRGETRLFCAERPAGGRSYTSAMAMTKGKPPPDCYGTWCIRGSRWSACTARTNRAWRCGETACSG